MTTLAPLPMVTDLSPSPMVAVPPLPPRPPLSPGRRLRLTLVGTLVATIVWALLFAFVLSPVHTAHEQHALYESFRTALAKQTAPGFAGGPIADGTAVSLLDAPRGGLGSVVVVEGTSSDVLQAGPGHAAASVLPGQAGTSVIYGRSVIFGAPFRHVTSLKKGDVIVATTQQGVSHYTVSGVRRPGDPLPPALAAGAGRLILVTSEGRGWRAGWAPSDVVYVDAMLSDPVKVAPARVAVQITPDEAPMQGDSSGLIIVVLGLQGLLLAIGFGVLAASRWTVVQAWLVASPLVMAALWVTTQHAMLLLPNLV